MSNDIAPTQFISQNDISPAQIICQRTPPEENATLVNRFKTHVHDLTHASMEQHKICFQEYFRVKVEKTSDCWNKMIEKIPGVGGTQAVTEGQNSATIEPFTSSSTSN